MPIKICHITTVHPRCDVRIFHKECKSLSDRYEVHLIVADGKGDELADGIHIHDIGKPQGRTDRILHSPKRALETALEIPADVYHFHDPELLPVGKKIAKRGKTVIYDSHEDLPRQILTKPWIPKYLRKPVSKLVEVAENSYVRKMSAIIAATPHIQRRFRQVTTKPVECVCNYTVVSEITASKDWGKKERAVCYVGGIFVERGIWEMLRAVSKSDTTLKLAGKFSPESLQSDVEQSELWKMVDYQGFIGRAEINEMLAQSMAGLLLLHPMPSYVESLPIKLFEYMSAGIPVVCSDFPLWREIVEKHGCGVCVNPFDADAVSQAIQKIVNNVEYASQMGRNGRNAVEKQYNWDSQAKALIVFYESLLEQRNTR